MRSTFLKTISTCGHARARLLTEDQMMKATTQITSKRFPAIGLAAAMLLAVTGFAGPLHAADVYLQAQRFEKTLTRPDAGTETVQMWGFASCTDATYTSCVIDAPGSQIRVTAGDELNIYLTNTLDTPVSIIIPGQVGGGDPTTMSSDTRRVQSFTREVAANTPMTPVKYTWSAVRPGTYLYQSGTQPSLQVPMGLYGALVVGPDVGDLDYVNSVLADAAGYYYRLGEAAVIDPAVDEVGGSDGTYGANVTPGLSLGYGTDKAAGFNATANDYVDTGVDMLSDTAFSVEAWVNANDTAGQHRIVAKDELGVFGQFILWFNSGKLRFQVYPSDGTVQGDWAIAEAPTAPPVGTTFHVVGVFDGTDVILYVDGVEVASTALGAATAITNSLPITIGASSLGLSPRDHIFDGSIDEVAIYESALTEEQIAEHFVANSYESVLLFSEIDPLQNWRVAYAETHAAGTPTQACVALANYIPMDGGYPCTIDYNPLYFLTNGEAAAELSAGAPGNSVRLSLLNAGLRTHTPSIVGLEMAVIAEDGHAYRGLPRRQSHALLPAGKTLEMFIGVDDGAGNLVMPAGVNADYSLFDRMPTFSNEGAPTNGGSLTSLQVGTGTPSGPPPEQTYFEEVYAVTEDTPLIIDPTGGDGVLVISEPSSGVVAVNTASPLTYIYTPNPDFSGTDSFIYQRNNGYTYLATLNVSFENDAPVAAADGPYVNAVGTEVTVDAAHGVLGNDTDPDGDTLNAILDTTSRLF